MALREFFTCVVITICGSTEQMQMPVTFAIDRPENRTVDINIGSNFSPLPLSGNHFLVVVDPLPDVCAFLSEKFHSNRNVAVLCCAVSNYTGYATFRRYNKKKGVSSSLAPTTGGTSHGKFRVLGNTTVIVLEAAVLLGTLVAKQNRVNKLKLDMQGFDLTALRNLNRILRMPDQILHLKAECFYPNDHGKQIYQVDNSCKTMETYLQSLGYIAVAQPVGREWGDVVAYKYPATSFLEEAEWG